MFIFVECPIWPTPKNGTKTVDGFAVFNGRGILLKMTFICNNQFFVNVTLNVTQKTCHNTLIWEPRDYVGCFGGKSEFIFTHLSKLPNTFKNFSSVTVA